MFKKNKPEQSNNVDLNDEARVWYISLLKTKTIWYISFYFFLLIFSLWIDGWLVCTKYIKIAV